MESQFKIEDLKRANNTAPNLVLAICFSGLFLMIVGGVSVVAVLVVGGSLLLPGISYLLSVAFYLGFIVAALTAAMLTFDVPVTKTAPISRKRIRFPH